MHWYDTAGSARRAFLRRLLKSRFAGYGAGASFDPTTSRIVGFENIRLGRGVFIGPYAVISANEPVMVGDDTIIGPGFILMTGNHSFRVPGAWYRSLHTGEQAPVTIGRNVWMGARVTILAGVTVGDGAVIAAGAVVNHDVPELTIAAGVPAKPIGPRFATVEDRERHAAFLAGDYGATTNAG